jgi:hypothetical protein
MLGSTDQHPSGFRRRAPGVSKSFDSYDNSGFDLMTIPKASATQRRYENKTEKMMRMTDFRRTNHELQQQQRNNRIFVRKIMILGPLVLLFLKLWTTSTTGGSVGGRVGRSFIRSSLSTALYGKHPRSVRLVSTSSIVSRGRLTSQRRSARNVTILTSRSIIYPMVSNEYLAHLLQSHDFATQGEPLETAECTQQFPWQGQQFPTCNTLHEQRLDTYQAQLINNGYWRDVWTVTNYKNVMHVLKSIRYKHKILQRSI